MQGKLAKAAFPPVVNYSLFGLGERQQLVVRQLYQLALIRE